MLRPGSLRTHHFTLSETMQQQCRKFVFTGRALISSGVGRSSICNPHQIPENINKLSRCLSSQTYRRPGHVTSPGHVTCRQNLLSVKPDLSISIPARHKSKKASKGKVTTHKVPDYELEEVVDIEEYKNVLEAQLKELREEFIYNLSVTTNLESLNRLPIATKDGLIPLDQLATVIQKSPTLIVIDLQRSPQYMVEVTETLKKSGVCQNPQQTSPTSLAIQLTKVSRERREELAKSTKTLFNAKKAKMSKIYTDFCKVVNKHTSHKDTIKTAQDALLEIKRQTESKGEEMMKAKQKELLQENK